jgi:DNA primase
MDAVAYYRAGFSNVVATMGVALSSEHLNALSTLTSLETIILSFDNDNAGQIATINHGQKLMENGFNTYVAGPYDKSIKDVDELLNKQGKEAINKILDERIDYVTFLIDNHFTKKMPLDETEKVVNDIIKTILDLGDNSILLRSKHLKLLAEKSGLEYQDLLTKYERDLQKINVILPNEKTFSKKPFKPTNTIGLDKTFIEGDEQPKEDTKEKTSYLVSIVKEMKSQKALIIRNLTEAYDYLIKTIINNPSLFSSITRDLTLNTNFEFEQQDLILKTIRYKYEKQETINDKTVLDFLKTKGEINSKYLKAYEYLFNQLNHPYYLYFTKDIFGKDGEKRLKTTIHQIKNYKNDLSLLNKTIEIDELNKNLSDKNKQQIEKTLLEIKTIKKLKN